MQRPCQHTLGHTRQTYGGDWILVSINLVLDISLVDSSITSYWKNTVLRRSL
ncbi:hypothetical protein M408DRAFT_330137 [Serendipita vermifera MAFF 305830]|uniref:Uncharacterized protein n=1 Tax=Serendipita vermifera MAFF 305830 TaxID=933852 RepID=A0A0C2WLN2_SERVB|nr:hypothetical protein M408DRAFT_330137 [Serendipita vermifera MAFF 305830]